MFCIIINLYYLAIVYMIKIIMMHLGHSLCMCIIQMIVSFFGYCIESRAVLALFRVSMFLSYIGYCLYASLCATHKQIIFSNFLNLIYIRAPQCHVIGRANIHYTHYTYIALLWVSKFSIMIKNPAIRILYWQVVPECSMK